MMRTKGMRVWVAGIVLAMIVTNLHRRADAAAVGSLLASNLGVPFCYQKGAVRRWPVLTSPLEPGVRCELSAWRNGQQLAQGAQPLRFEGLAISIASGGWLAIESVHDAQGEPFELEIRLDGPGGSEAQRLAVRAAPPLRPLSYIADFGDDLIDLFCDSKTGRWRPLEKGAFDAYFRKLQAHGIARLIVWQSPFPYMANPANYSREDWQRYAGQARAMIESPELEAILAKRAGVTNWGWIRQLMKLRLTPEFGDLLTQSARDHGIKLTASFRPFEMALDKYYAVPVFDESGAFLWNFHPLASPAVDGHAHEVGFAHYRTILASMGQAHAAQPAVIEITGVTDAAAFVDRFRMKQDNLRIVAAPFPPLQHDGWVLVRKAGGHFQLRPFQEIAALAEAKCVEVRDLQVERDGRGTVRITAPGLGGVGRYLILSNPSGCAEALDAPAALPATVFAKAGNTLGRTNVYWVTPPEDGDSERTRVGAITADGGFHSEFYAVEFATNRAQAGPARRSLLREQIVIDLGEPWSVEMVDFNQPAARRYVVKELQWILSHPPFDEIFINTRSHTSLAATMGDGADGLKPRAEYAAAKKPYVHLGIDRAYAPRGAADHPRLRALAATGKEIEKITSWQPGEWEGTCQTPDSTFAWRLARNQGVAAGVRQLLIDLEAAFPQTRVRVVIPERAQAVARVSAALATMEKPGGGTYGRDYYKHLWASINHIPSIGEGMTLLDLTGLRAEPVFGGIRYLPDWGPFELFVREVIADLRGNLGASFKGPRSFFYEGHETLKAVDQAAARKGREERIRHLLNQRGEINEVILYEAAAWLGLPLQDADLCGHGFLDRQDSPALSPSK